MIKHHPKTDFLAAFACGELPASLSAAIAVHVDRCIVCSNQVKALTEEQAEALELANTQAFDQIEPVSFDFDAMINRITDDATLFTPKVIEPKVINVGGNEYQLPKAISNMEFGNWVGIGKLTRARINLDEGDVHTSLLEIQPQGAIPQHTHKGFELTVLLEGSFKDEMGEYHAGDFIMLDGEHTHNPVTDDGCLCLTVVSDKLIFTQGVNKLLNPIGGFIY